MTISGCRRDLPLADLTAELTAHAGRRRPARCATGCLPTLATWIERGVYDDLLAGLGDGMAAGLRVGIGERGTDTVFRRSFSALVLAECIARDNQRPLVPGGKVLEWGDRLATVAAPRAGPAGLRARQGLGPRRRPRRGRPGRPRRVAPPGHGRADRAARRDRRAAAAARRPACSSTASPTGWRGDDAGAAPRAGAVRRRGAVDRPARRAAPDRPPAAGDADPYLDTRQHRGVPARALPPARARPEPPAVRADLLLVLVDALRTTNPPLPGHP